MASLEENKRTNQKKHFIIDLVLSVSSTLGTVTESLCIGDEGKDLTAIRTE